MDRNMTIGRKETVIEQERLARLIRLAARAFNRSLQIRLQAEGITFGQWIFMRILWEEDGLSQKVLSQRAGLTEPTTHSAIKRMEKAELVERQKLEGNRRKIHTFLTAKGWSLRERLEPLATEANLVAVAGLTAEEVTVMRKGLLAVIENLGEDERRAAHRGIKVPATRATIEV
jgi:DNA-binding MarR family transcriptional regulator